MPKMITINLLDWREARREARKNRFLLTLGTAAAISAGIVLLAWLWFNQAIDYQNQRNKFLQDEIAKIERQIQEIRELEKTRDNLITRMRIIEQLQQSRAEIVHYFDQVVETLPDGVYLTSLKQNGNTTTVNGVAESNGRVSTYMVNLDESPWFNDPRLVVIKSLNKDRRRFASFTLTFKTVTPKPEDLAKDKEPTEEQTDGEEADTEASDEEAQS